MFGRTAVAQEEQGIPTLRVYADLVQLPTLVLNLNRQPIRSLGQRKFVVRIDGGPPLHLTHVRLEGDDPIALSVLLDIKAIPAEELAKLPGALAGLAPKSLHPVDEVSVYTLDCQLMRTAAEGPTTPEGLQKAATVALNTSQGSEKPRSKESCRDRWTLLDAVSSATRRLAQQPGRRVILLVTNGAGADSQPAWEAVRQLAQMSGVAIFAMVPTDHGLVPVQNSRSGAVLEWRPTDAIKDLNTLCETSGGMILNSSPRSLDAQLRNFISLLRGRYILEFRRPATAAGMHNLNVSIEKMPAFIRPSGSSFPLPDPELEKNPMSPPDQPEAPDVGTEPQEPSGRPE